MKARSVHEVLALYERWGTEHYDEAVSQLDHAVQSAARASASGAADDLVAAALLHDVGHLLELAHDRGPKARSSDLRHESRGASFLGALFPAPVTAPILLHVQAKRYLCATEPGYHDGLSDGSRRSLELQGGPLDEHERAAFESQPGWHDAVRLRRWDDGGKVVGLEPAPVCDYGPLLARVSR
jgi:phosphonate degradation associated HDIG domain protein